MGSGATPRVRSAAFFCELFFGHKEKWALVIDRKAKAHRTPVSKLWKSPEELVSKSSFGGVRGNAPSALGGFLLRTFLWPQRKVGFGYRSRNQGAHNPGYHPRIQVLDPFTEAKRLREYRSDRRGRRSLRGLGAMGRGRLRAVHREEQAPPLPLMEVRQGEVIACRLAGRRGLPQWNRRNGIAPTGDI